MTPQQQVAGILTAAWLAENYPDLFNELAVQLNPAGAPRDVYLAPPTVGLAGFTDTLSSIWGAVTNVAGKVASGLGTAVKTVGTFLGSEAGQSALSALVASKYGSNSMQTAVVNTQLNRTQAGQTPAPIETRYDPATGVYTPVLTQQTGTTYELNPQLLNQLQPTFIEKYGLWMVGLGFGVVALILLTNRR